MEISLYKSLPILYVLFHIANISSSYSQAELHAASMKADEKETKK